ncbi:MAG: hypothetical protein UY92_C0002G0003 [Candidatus Magasanikbacteria bacterium GW2011_GWA2_56_11]|uniref:Uncharacterized protein n=1 Tax=Candidatus Magasanikbacteria bacterium GW2011_GWA2_56_11 TaxID=1619044 RepID=A0A0G1YI22_9BACT|nr:MAG: hypothetical protein UY92_C0002G0003 [Candidatus Magasanikbacteria bacterium GW2011_GWA2_56_11]
MIRILARYVGISLLAITLIASVSPAYGVVSGPTAQKPATANGSQVGNNIKAPAKAGPTIYGVKLGVPTDKPIVPGGVAQFTILYQTKKNGPFAPATYYNHTVSLLGVGNAEALDDQGHYQVSLTKNNGEPLPAGEFPVRVKTQNGVFTPGSIFAHEVKVWGVKAEIKNKPPIYVGDPLYFTVSYQLEENGPFYSLTLPNHKIEIKGLGQILPLNQFGQYSVVLKKPTGELLPAGEYVINSAQYNNKGEWEGNLGVDVFTIEESQIFGVKIEYLDPAPYYTGEKVRFRTLYQLEPDGPYVPRSLGAYQLGVKKTDQNLYAPLKKLNQKGYYMATFRGENGVNLPAGTYIYELKDESGKLHFDTIEVADAKVNAVKYQLLSPAQAYGGNTIEFKLNYQLGSSPGFIGKTFTGHSVTVEGSDDAWIAAAYPLDKQGLYQVSLRDKKNQSFPPGSYFVVVNTHEGALGDSGFALGGLVVKDKSSQPPIDPDDILKYSPAIGDKDGGPGDGKLEEIIKKTDDVIIKPVEPRSKEDSGKDRAKEPTASEDPKSAPGVTESGPVIASLAVTNKDNGAWLGTANSGYQTLGTYAAKQLITVPGTIAEVYFKPAIKSQSASDTYGYVWVDSGTGPTNFDATLAAKLAAKANFFKNDYNTIPVTDYYRGRYITLLLFARDNDGASRVANMPVEVDDVIAVHVEFLPKAAPTASLACADQTGGDGSYTLCWGKKLTHSSGVSVAYSSLDGDGAWIVLNGGENTFVPAPSKSQTILSPDGKTSVTVKVVALSKTDSTVTVQVSSTAVVPTRPAPEAAASSPAATSTVITTPVRSISRATATPIGSAALLALRPLVIDFEDVTADPAASYLDKYGVTFTADNGKAIFVGPANRNNAATASGSYSLMNDATFPKTSANDPLVVKIKNGASAIGFYLGNANIYGIQATAKVTLSGKEGNVLATFSDTPGYPVTTYFGAQSSQPVYEVRIDYGDTTLSEVIDSFMLVPSAAAFVR